MSQDDFGRALVTQVAVNPPGVSPSAQPYMNTRLINDALAKTGTVSIVTAGVYYFTPQIRIPANSDLNLGDGVELREIHQGVDVPCIVGSGDDCGLTGVGDVVCTAATAPLFKGANSVVEVNIITDDGVDVVPSVLESSVPANPSAAPAGVVVDGDSISVQWQEVTTNSISQSNGIATAVLATSTNEALVGADVNVRGHAQEGYNGLKKVLAVPTSTTIRYAVDPATPSPGSAGTYGRSTAIYNKRGEGFMIWAESLVNSDTGMSRDYGLINAGGRGGRHALEIAAEFDEQVLQYNPAVVVMLVTVNGPNQTISVDNSVAAYVQMINKCLARGIRPVVILAGPLGGAFNITAAVNEIIETNTRIDEYCRTRNVPTINAYEIGVDATDAADNPQAALIDTSDGLHWGGGFHKLVGERLKTILDGFGMGRSRRLSASLLDQFGSAGSYNLLANSALAGTSGTEAGSATGDTANGYTLTRNGTCVTAGSKGTVGAFGVSQIITWTASGATGDGWAFDSEALHSRIVAGSKLSCGARIKVIGATQPFRLEVGLLLTPTGGTLGQLMAMCTWVSTRGFPAGDYEIVPFSAQYTVPEAATFSTALFRVRLRQCAVLSAGAIDISQPTVYQYPA